MRISEVKAELEKETEKKKYFKELFSGLTP